MYGYRESYRTSLEPEISLCSFSLHLTTHLNLCSFCDSFSILFFLQTDFFSGASKFFQNGSPITRVSRTFQLSSLTVSQFPMARRGYLPLKFRCPSLAQSAVPNCLSGTQDWSHSVGSTAASPRR